MAAYAALVSLFNTLDHIHNHPRFSTSFAKYHIESLGAHINFLLDFVVTFNIDGDLRQGVQELKSQIVCAAHEAEDIVESYVVNQILPAEISDVRLHHGCLFGLQRVIEGMDSLKENVVKIKEEIISGGFKYDHNPTNSIPAAASSATDQHNRMVGFEAELMQLKDVLIVQQSSRRQIISIVGMGGTGKTTLATNVYQDSLIMHHFDLRAWATVSQDYDVREILLHLLSETEGTIDELGEKLHKKLFGRRYLIVLDDMWSMEVWDRIKFFFPDNVNGSRIILTTRFSNLTSICIKINFLDEEKSWNLFCQKVFGGQQDCPVELEGVGKKIVEQCKGLPLSIVVIGELLKKSHRTQEYWQNVSKNINEIFNSREYGHCLDVLYLSYSHLPAHLKPCFLYTGTFKEDSEIRVSEIIRLWVAEGFLKPNGVQILEEMAEDYLKDLIDRNLIFVCKRRLNGKIRCFRIHDLLRELCLKVAHKEKLFCVVRGDSISQGMDKERRLVVFHDSKVLKAFQSTSLARSLICNVSTEAPPSKCRLLRVYNGPDLSFRSGGVEFQNVNLRYLCCEVGMLPCSISLIWNLQTLVINDNYGITAPLEIWKMRQLRHLKCFDIVVPDPPESDDKDESVVLGNLQTLTGVRDFRLSEEACKRIPNVKKLRIEYDADNGLYEVLENLGRLQRLDSLSIISYQVFDIGKLKKTFPSSLNKLSLEGSIVDNLEELSMIIGSLPQLEVVKLRGRPHGLQKWTCVEGAFRRLKFLSIQGAGLEWWSLEGGSHFPVLEKLFLIDLDYLNEIPFGIGEIPALQLISLEYCTHSLVISAMKIKEEQESYGNDALQIQVKIFPEDREGLMERVKVEGLSIDNIHLQYNYLQWN